MIRRHKEPFTLSETPRFDGRNGSLYASCFSVSAHNDAAERPSRSRHLLRCVRERRYEPMPFVVSAKILFFTTVARKQQVTQVFTKVNNFIINLVVSRDLDIEKFAFAVTANVDPYRNETEHDLINLYASPRTPKCLSSISLPIHFSFFCRNPKTCTDR